MPTTPVPGAVRRRSPRVALTAVLACAAMTVSLFGAVPMPGAGAQDEGATPAEAAASWAADQLVDGERFETTFGGTSYPDQGVTIDGILAFAAAGVADGAAAEATDWLEQSSVTSGYIGDGTAESYAGALAKLAFAAQVRDLDPTSWGQDGIDLIARLKEREQENGRFSDQSQYGDFSNTIGQSLAIIVLTRHAGEDPSTASIDMLLQSQCADGGFALELEPGEGCTSGVDTTAYAIQALTTAGTAAAEVTDAVDHLLAAQQDSGGFGTNGTEPANANSTGLAAHALRTAGEDGAVADAVAFLQTLQIDCDDEDQTHLGAVDFDGGEFDEATAVRATTQAVLGFVGEGFDTLSAAGATDEQPTFVCGEETTSTPTTAPPGGEATPVASDGAVAPTGAIAPTPVATAVVARPTLTG